MNEWDILVAQATLEAAANRWRQSADFYRKAYESSPANWQWRYCCISGYTSILREEYIKPTKDDLAFLKIVHHDEHMSPLIRAQASFTRGLLRFASSDREGAARSYRNVLQLISGASASDRSARVMMSSASGDYSLQPASLFLDEIEKTARSNLAVLERKERTIDAHFSVSESGVEASFSGAAFNPRDMLRPVFALGLNATAADREENADVLRHRLAVGGGECDECSRPAGADGSALLMCSRCSVAWYCSKACQTRAWPAHKPHCGPLRAGDLAMLRNLERSPALNGHVRSGRCVDHLVCCSIVIMNHNNPCNGQVVRVVSVVNEEAPRADRRWECTLVGGEEGRRMSVRACNLRRVRPPASRADAPA